MTKNEKELFNTFFGKKFRFVDDAFMTIALENNSNMHQHPELNYWIDDRMDCTKLGRLPEETEALLLDVAYHHNFEVILRLLILNEESYQQLGSVDVLVIVPISKWNIEETLNSSVMNDS